MRSYRDIDIPELSEAQHAEYTALARAISEQPEAAAPPDLLGGVMSRIQPKRLPWWKRAAHSLGRRRDVCLAPAQVIPVGAAIFALLLACLLLPSDTTQAPVAELGAPVAQAPEGVTFTYQAPQAANVALIGNFNDWTPSGYEMHFDAERQVWVIEVPLPKGRHEYAFLVDYNRVVPDPRAVITHQDGFGNSNSVVVIGDGATHEL